MTDIPPESLLTRKLLIRRYAVATDIHPFVSGVRFDRVRNNKIRSKFGKTEVYFASLGDLIAMKRAAGRPKDREDLNRLLRLRLRKNV